MEHSTFRGPRRSVLAPGRPKPPVALPSGIELEFPPEEPTLATYRDVPLARPSLRLTRRWFRVEGVVGLVLSILFFVFLVPFSSEVLKTNQRFGAYFGVLVQAMVGFWLLYRTLALTFNRTRVTISAGRFRVEHGPFPARGNLDVDIREVRQLYTTRKFGNKGSVSYRLHAILATGPTVTIARGLYDVQQALYIEQEVERTLGLTDYAVPGEVEELSDEERS